MSARRSSEYSLCAAACSALLVACHPGPSARADFPGELQWTTPAPCDTSTATSQRLGAIKAARDSLLRDVQVRRAAWRARGISDYRVRIALRCVCPFSPPADAPLTLAGGTVPRLSNTRLKLAARVDCGMNLSSARRSLSAIR